MFIFFNDSCNILLYSCNILYIIILESLELWDFQSDLLKFKSLYALKKNAALCSYRKSILWVPLKYITEKRTWNWIQNAFANIRRFIKSIIGDSYSFVTNKKQNKKSEILQVMDDFLIGVVCVNESWKSITWKINPHFLDFNLLSQFHYNHQLHRIFIYTNIYLVQKQPFSDAPQTRLSHKFLNIYRETSMPESFFDKAAGSQLTSLLKKGMQEFSCDFCKIFKNSFIKQTLLETGYEIWNLLPNSVT